MKLSPENIKEMQEKSSKLYSGEEAERLGFYLNRVNYARDERAMPRKEFDDKTYEQDYIDNKLAYASYRRKKKNDSENRIASGTTEKKMEVVINELLSSDFETEFHAYDKEDTQLEDLGKAMTDVVRRTKEIEQDDDKKVDVIQELLGQRALFIEELCTIKTVIDKKKVSNRVLGIDLNTGEYEKKEYTTKRVEKRILSGLQIYLGNPYLPAYRFQEQPFLVKYETMSYEEAQLLYGKWANWKYVKSGTSQGNEWFDGAFNYRFSENLDEDEIEIVHYMCYPDDEYQVIINGVMMLNIKTPLPWEKEGYNIEMTIIKPIHRNFSYGSSIVASASTLQALSDESIRMGVRKFKQGMEPPLAIKTKRTLSKDIYNPAAITYGLDKNKISKLIDHNGVDGNDMGFIEYIDGMVKDFIGQGDLAAGVSESGAQTAKEVTILRTQALKMLGLSVYGLMSYHKKADFLRLFNIMENYTSPVDLKYDPVSKQIQEVYQKFTLINSDLGRGKKGKKVIQFIDRDLTGGEEESIYDFEREQEEKGKPVKLNYLNAKKVRMIRLTWYAVVTQKFRDSNELKQAMFNDKLIQAVNISKITGIPFNSQKLVEDFERLWEAKDFFDSSAVVPGLEQEQAGGGGEMEGLLKEIGDLENSAIGSDLGADATQKPSVNTLANA